MSPTTWYVLSLFAGIGGLDLGLERAGMTVVGQVEIDPFCQRVLAKHWPEVPRHDDVRTAVEWWLGATRPRVDVVCGGFPCQPVSVAGKQLAQADERWLWPAMWAVIRDLRPRWAVLENVPGLLGRGMGDVLGDLAAIGYDAEWDCVSAAAVGAPHRRDRVFVVAHAGGDAGRVQPVAEPGRGGATFAGDDGAPWALADTAGARCPAGSRGAGGAAWDEARRPRPDGLGGDVADPDRATGRCSARNAVAGVGRGQVRLGAPQSGRRGSHVAHANGERQPQPGGRLGEVWGRPSDSGWWRTEPDVGRTLDGFSAWLDGSGRLEQAHKLVLAYANAADVDPAEALRALRNAHGADSGGRSAGGRGSLPASAVLLAYLRQLEAHGRKAGPPLAGEEAPEAGLRSVRVDEVPARPPLRREPGQQRPGEPSDALRPLSQLLARAAEQAWSAYRRSGAGATGWGWEDGYARVAHGVPNRVDRLRSLGNAVVPQVAEHIGRLVIGAAA